MPQSLRRVGSVIGLGPEHADRYEELHAAVWPGVLAQLRDSNIRNYSIFRHGDLLFAYFEYVGDDWDADMERMRQDPSTQEWWRTVEPLQRPLDDRAPGEWWKTLPEVFHVD